MQSVSAMIGRRHILATIVLLFVAVTASPAAAQSLNAWPRELGWGYVPPFGFGFNWNNPYPEDIVAAENKAYCARRFRSYDPISETYLGRNGVRHACPPPYACGLCEGPRTYCCLH
jgi:hypothetical protein